MKKIRLLVLLAFNALTMLAQESDELPVSKFSPDSTVINISISNYNPKYKDKVSIFNYIMDFNKKSPLSEYKIPVDGKLRIAFRPFFPETVFIGFEGQKQIPLVIVPGGCLSVMLDMDLISHDIKVVETTGTLETVNHEINVDNAKDYIKYNNDSTYIVKNVMPRKRMIREASDLMFQYRDSIDRIKCYSAATKEWLQMYNISEYKVHVSMLNKICVKTIESELRNGSNQLLNFADINSRISNLTVVKDEWEMGKIIAQSPKMTLYPDYLAWFDFGYAPPIDKITKYNQNIVNFNQLMVYYLADDIEGSKQILKRIKDEEMKSFFSNRMGE